MHPNDPYGLFWRTCPSDLLQGKVLATNVIGMDATITSVTAVFINNAYGQGLATVFQSSYAGQTFLVPYDDAAIVDQAGLAKLAAAASAKGGGAVLLIAEHGNIASKILGAMVGLPIAAKPFFFTDGSKDGGLLDPMLAPGVQAILKKAQGTAPASPQGLPNYMFFASSLLTQFGIDGASVSFLAQAYDAAYVGAFGVVLASKDGTQYDGLDVAAGMAHLSAGDLVPLNGVSAWPTGKGLLTTKGQINVDGVSGHLDFDAKTGEAPGRIVVWSIDTTAEVFKDGITIPPG